MKKLSGENIKPSQIACYNSPIGTLIIEATENFITKIKFAANNINQNVKGNLPLENCLEQLDQYFHHNYQNFDVPIKFEGTAFQVKVWKELQKIPSGKTVSYGEIAKNLGDLKAVRAVGGAIHNNPIVIIVPCHRVIGSNAKLIGFGGGLWRKKWLLTHEKNLLL